MADPVATFVGQKFGDQDGFSSQHFPSDKCDFAGAKKVGAQEISWCFRNTVSKFYGWKTSHYPPSKKNIS
jgi:hypothetical protein